MVRPIPAKANTIGISKLCRICRTPREKPCAKNPRRVGGELPTGGVFRPRSNHFLKSTTQSRNTPSIASSLSSKGDSVMWTFIEDLYREYCLARLQEMRTYQRSH